MNLDQQISYIYIQNKTMERIHEELLNSSNISEYSSHLGGDPWTLIDEKIRAKTQESKFFKNGKVCSKTQSNIRIREKRISSEQSSIKKPLREVKQFKNTSSKQMYQQKLQMMKERRKSLLIKRNESEAKPKIKIEQKEHRILMQLKKNIQGKREHYAVAYVNINEDSSTTSKMPESINSTFKHFRSSKHVNLRTHYFQWHKKHHLILR